MVHGPLGEVLKESLRCAPRFRSVLVGMERSSVFSRAHHLLFPLPNFPSPLTRTPSTFIKPFHTNRNCSSTEFCTRWTNLLGLLGTIFRCLGTGTIYTAVHSVLLPRKFKDFLQCMQGCHHLWTPQRMQAQRAAWCHRRMLRTLFCRSRMGQPPSTPLTGIRGLMTVRLMTRSMAATFPPGVPPISLCIPHMLNATNTRVVPCKSSNVLAWCVCASPASRCYSSAETVLCFGAVQLGRAHSCHILARCVDHRVYWFSIKILVSAAWCAPLPSI